MVKFEVAGVDHQTGRAGNAQPHCIGDGVADMEELHLERANLYRFARFDGAQIGFSRQPIASKFDFHQAKGQRRSINRRRDALEDVLDGPDVIFMPVSDHNPDDFCDFSRLQIFKIRDDVIDPDHVIIWKHQACINDQDLVVNIHRPSCSCRLPRVPPGE